MPFTVSHIAAVVPIHWINRRFSLSALAIGSMAPDFPYLFGGLDWRTYTHSISGILKISWPVGLAALYVFHAYLKEPLFWLLPASHRERLRRTATAFYWGSPGRVLGISALVLIGAWTHKCWDAFTHAGNVTSYLHLDGVIDTVSGMPIRTYSILQWLSSVGGLLLLVVWYGLWYLRQPEPDISEAEIRRSWLRTITALLVIATTFCLIVVGVIYGCGRPANLTDFKVVLGYSVIGCLSSFAIWTWLYATAYWLRQWRRREIARSAY